MNIEDELDALIEQAQYYLADLKERVEVYEDAINLAEVEDFLTNGPGYGKEQY